MNSKNALHTILQAIVMAFCLSCNQNARELEEALVFAGDNRQQLERVLEHYANEPERLEAARFLISNMAEIELFEPGNDTPSYGEIIGTDGFCGFNAHMTKDKMFDGDPLTAFDAPLDHGAWAGMDFGHPVTIDRIRYTGRGDGNAIEAGDTYELLYWHNGAWLSMGRQIATGAAITYRNVPQGTIYLLRDLTKGHDERIFTYADNHQLWW